MATDNLSEFDLGPLSWVQGEIDQALSRSLDSLAQFKANPADATPLKHARTHAHQAAGAIQMVGLDAVVAFTDEARAAARAARGHRSGRGRPGLRRRRPRVSQAQDIPRRARQRRDARAAQALSGIRGDAIGARRQGRGADGSLLPGLEPSRAAHHAARGDRTQPPAVLSRQAAAHVPARPPCVAARRRDRRGHDARRHRRHRGHHDARQPARVLVDGRRDVRRARRARPRRGLRREATRSARRPADSPCVGRKREGRRSTASRSALLRRDLRAGRPAGAGRAARVQALGAHSLRGSPVRGRRAPAADPARGARAADGRQGRVAQGSVGTRGEPSQAQADARVGACQGGRDSQRRADEAHRCARRAPGEDAGLEHSGAGRDGICDRVAAGRERLRELLEPVGRFPEAGGCHARAARRRALGPLGACVGRADARRDEQARAGARAARASRPRDPGQPASHGAGARRVLPRQREARGPGDPRQGQRADPRRVAHPRPGRSGSSARAVRAADRAIRRSERAGGQRRTSSSSPNRCRDWVSTSRRSSSSARTATG